jgi:nickel/cobalt transporter (NicO) family protein
MHSLKRRTFAWLGGLIAVLAMLVLLAPAFEAQAQASPLGVQTTEQASPSAAFGGSQAPQAQQGISARFFAWVMETQQSLYRQLANAVRKLKTEHALAAAFGLAFLSFIYGVVHAVGPGHGKAIISAYVVANEETVKRGILISFLAAGVQALTAIALVGILAIALKATGLQMNIWAHRLESASYALIAFVGAWLLVSQLAVLWRRHGRKLQISASAAPAQAIGHAHHHDHGHAHDHDHHHDHGECCGHMPDVKSLAGPFSWRKMAAVVLSVGIRPCTGAIVVLVFALAQGLFWAGVGATFAMALGTAITVAALATLAVGSRELAVRLGRGNSAWTETVWSICAIGGASLILLLGLTLFIGSLGPARPF